MFKHFRKAGGSSTSGACEIPLASSTPLINPHIISLCVYLSSSGEVMEEEKQRNAGWVCVSVPQFGEWDQKGVIPDYSMDFTKIREMRKQNKRELSRASLGNEEELISSTSTSTSTSAHTHLHTHSPTGRRTFFSYFNCCVKA